MQPPIISLPGSVTASVRNGWQLLGCLSAANPNVLDESGAPRIKTEIREITHLHHALDACVLALASHYIPHDGTVWELIVKRRPSGAEQLQLQQATKGIFKLSADRRFGISELPDDLKNQLRQRLADRRVVQHIPSEMSGLRVEQNAWRVVKVDDGEALLQQRIRQADGSRPTKEKTEKTGKLLGIEPKNGRGKLQTNKAALVIPDNFGIALDPEPIIIPFHKVWERLQALKKANSGKTPRILRNGTLIKISKGKSAGIWRVFSVKNNASGVALDIGKPDVVKLKNKTQGHRINVLVASLLRDGMETAGKRLTGVSECPSTLSV